MSCLEISNRLTLLLLRFIAPEQSHASGRLIAACRPLECMTEGRERPKYSIAPHVHLPSLAGN